MGLASGTVANYLLCSVAMISDRRIIVEVAAFRIPRTSTSGVAENEVPNAKF